MRNLAKYGAVTVALGLLLSYADIRARDSKYEAFTHIRIGMPEATLVELLRSNGVQCVAMKGQQTYATYDFSDYAREYHISVDQTGRVGMLRFDFNRGPRGLQKIWRRR